MNHLVLRHSIILSLILLLGACSSQPPAPITDRPLAGSRQAAGAKSAVNTEAGSYVIRKGDTLYRIALDNGLAYRDLAAWNDLTDVNDIKVDQVLRLTPPEEVPGVEIRPLRDAAPAVSAAVASVPSTVTIPAPAASRAYPKALKLPFGSQGVASIDKQAEGTEKTAIASKSVSSGASRLMSGASAVKSQEKIEQVQQASTPADTDDMNWLAPTAGKLLKSYSDEAKGVDIGGKMGQAVLASESGKVVYAGSGLRGYGKMIIVKHNSAFLTAYAHNSKLLVKEGDAVRRGEKIAEMGNSDAEQVKLHFEWRKFGKPVDPTKFITADKP